MCIRDRCRNSCHTSWLAPTAQRAKRLPRFSSVASPTSREGSLIPMARKDSAKTNTPKKAGRFAQIRQVFTAAHSVDPMIGWWMALASLGTLVVMVVIGVLVKHWVYFLVLGIPTATLAASTVLSVRAKRAAYKSIEGQPGASGAALSSLRKGWYFEQQPVAADAGRAGDMSSAAMVFRATGRPGVILVVEGPEARATKLGEAERKKVSRVAGPNVPVTVIRVGEGGGEDEVSVRKVAGKLQRMKPVLTLSLIHI